MTEQEAVAGADAGVYFPGYLTDVRIYEVAIDDSAVKELAASSSQQDCRRDTA
jgi:hypothetical protein